MNADRLPPHDERAEKGILGGILRDPDVYDSVAAIIRPESFYFDAHGRIFRAFGGLVAERVPIDMVSVHEHLRQRNEVAEIGGPVVLAELWVSVPTGANAEYHAKLVRDAAIARGLIHAANMIIRDAFDRTQPAEELLASAESALFALADGGARGFEIRCAAQFLPAALDRIDSRIAADGALDGLSTGLIDLDQTLGGFRPGQLIVLGARPSVGKTALALTIAANVVRSGTPALFFSMEMPEVEIANRLLSMGSGVPMSKFTRGRSLNEDESARIVTAASPAGFGKCPLWLDDASEQSAARIASTTRQAVRRHEIGLVVVDYLQLMTAENPRENRALQVGTMARRLKHLARECGIPVLLLSQLNRDVENRGDGKPRLADLRESGDIEAHADAVILLHRPNDQELGIGAALIDALVRKNRNGPTADVTLCFFESVMRFENAAKHWQQEPHYVT